MLDGADPHGIVPGGALALPERMERVLPYEGSGLYFQKI
jgi:hypothetical protein